MSRPSTPPQFVLDEELDHHDDHRSQSSQTESLLLHSNDPPHAYPPLPREKDSRLADDDDDDDEGDSSDPRRDRPVPLDSFSIEIPTRTAVLEARRNPKRRARHPKLVVGGLCGLLTFAYLSTQLLALGTRFNGHPKVQVILMISDGMGPASETFARSYLRYLHETNSTTTTTTDGSPRSLLNESVWAGLEDGFRQGRGGEGGGTPLDSMLVGTSRTRSTSSLITDSAAGATAFSCLAKTYNGAIGVSPSRAPCGTILEAAHRQGFATGFATTSRVTHATPAALYSHVVDRDLESEIATFLVGLGPQGQVVDLALGGGRCYFVGGNGSTPDGCRTDEDDLLARAKERGVRVLEGMKALRDWKDEDFDSGGKGSSTGAVLGLFAKDHMDYEVDRQRTTILADEQPSLKEMTLHALRYLKRRGSKGKGFFLMIEGARIDMAAHNNDPIAHLSDILAYYETVQHVKQWVDHENDYGTPTLLISVSDHETGGLALGRQLSDVYPEYLWYPDALVNATHSTSYLGSLVADRYPSTTREWVRSEVYEKGLGIRDVASWELDQLWMNRTDAYRANRVLADAISRRAQVGWSTAGHSGVDVNLYAYGHNATGLAGCVENTEVGEFVAHTMGLNLDVVTIELNKNLKWFDRDAGNATTRTTEYAHYHGDF